MRIKNLLLAATAVVALASCGGAPTTGTESAKSETTTKATDEVLTIDALLAGAEANTDKIVSIKGVCTHTCRHGARKMFLMGSDDTKVIRVEAGELGAFDTKCINNMVEVKGKLVEQRIDEAYLQEWEAQLAEHAAEEHGHGEEGCASEKQARGETGNTTDSRIADFRKKIAERKAESGKEYLSFYFVEAQSYEIQ